MRTKFSLILLICISFSLTACQMISDITGSNRPVSVTLGDPFILMGGQAAFIKGGDLQITFESILEDSRCPQDVECVWEGEAKVQLSILHIGNSSETLILSTLMARGIAQYLHYDLKLLELTPYPSTAGGEIEFEDYKATLLVTEQ